MKKKANAKWKTASRRAPRRGTPGVRRPAAKKAVARSSARRSLPHSYPPMEAASVETLPTGTDWQYEPKWDGFRCIAFRGAKAVDLRSKADRPLGRYFPDIVDAILALPIGDAVLDGELAIPTRDGLSFDDLLQRIHPAASRVRTLVAQHPAVYILFDLLADAQGRPLVHLPLSKRRALLETLSAKAFQPMPRSPGGLSAPAVVLSPSTRDHKVATGWLERGSSGWGGLDGVIAKALDLPYQSGTRTGMQKVKNLRTADCIVGGFRYASKGGTVGSLLLGLYDADGLLHHVGFTSGMSATMRAELTPRLVRLIKPPGFTGRAPGGPSRWSTRRTDEWKPLAPKLVVEVQYDHFSDGRFRHGTGFVRWRPDKAPRQCTLDQIAPTGRSALRLLMGNRGSQAGQKNRLTEGK